MAVEARGGGLVVALQLLLLAVEGVHHLLTNEEFRFVLMFELEGVHRPLLCRVQD